ncbi:hypothetical protein MJO28_005697 [Puccinia striiformis f. sp. tritici]|uniref:Uncharacterized protein n=1 Tax=Puccinia striiformis f. sp. tritici TaxID=168172 RepID=A0ACC0EN53_9BASI|nr:hypothetical protein MJO28_005697 [Puccinia striiformis f. sp. tritici]
MSDQSAPAKANSRPSNNKTLAGSKSRLDQIKHSFGILTPSPDATPQQEGAPGIPKGGTLSNSLSIEALSGPGSPSTFFLT